MQAGKKRKFCGHCEEYLLNPAFKKHKDIYYDTLAKTWTRKEDILMQRPATSIKYAYDEQVIAGITLPVKFVHIKLVICFMDSTSDPAGRKK